MKCHSVISIIVPLYNVQKYIKNCIRSVLNQTFTDYELILIDDGSTDGSKEICQSFQEKDWRIRLVTYQNNMGMSCARNRGMDLASGKYIFFLDSDDMIHPQLLMEMFQQAENYNLDMVMTEFVMSKSKTGDWWESYCEEQFAPQWINLSGDALWDYWFNMDRKFSIGGKLFRAEKMNDLRFDENMNVSEDAKFNYQFLIQEPRKISYTKSPGYYYRIRKNNASNSVTFEKLLLSVEMKQGMRDYELSAGRRENAVIIEQSLIRQIQEWLNKVGHGEKEDIKKCRTLVSKEKKNALFKEMSVHKKSRLFLSSNCPSLYQFLRSLKKGYLPLINDEK